jgi:hypothetical protein
VKWIKIKEPSGTDVYLLEKVWLVNRGGGRQTRGAADQVANILSKNNKCIDPVDNYNELNSSSQ